MNKYIQTTHTHCCLSYIYEDHCVIVSCTHRQLADQQRSRPSRLINIHVLFAVITIAPSWSPALVPVEREDEHEHPLPAPVVTAEATLPDLLLAHRALQPIHSCLLPLPLLTTNTNCLKLTRLN